MSKYLDELTAITEAREAFNERTRRLHESRGVPTHVPLVATPNDDEMMQYMADGEALVAREKAFDEKYFKPGIDPHTID
jgi:hypothetical protein